MIPWFFRDPERLTRERRGIEELLRSAKWLVGAKWLLDGGLCLDAVIRAHGHDYEVRVSFPTLYPGAPSFVRPRNIRQRLTFHQYGGIEGPLCLEWGPDNWHPDITAVQMLESAHRLFDTENPLGEDRPDARLAAPSRHRLTMGQELRGKWARWYASRGLAEYLAAQPEGAVGSFKFSFREAGGSWLALVHEAMPLGGAPWSDDEVPTTIPEAQADDLRVGVWLKTEIEGGSIGRRRTLSELQALVAGMEGAGALAVDGSSPVEGFPGRMAGVLIVDRAGELHLFIVFSGNDVTTCSSVGSEIKFVESRSPDRAALSDKTIGIVGLGSVGSKIGISLARMGVRRFHLVDHDVLLPENLQRHALDWQAVAQHKVDAMKLALDRVAPGAHVEVCDLDITGQESNALVSAALSRLADCDVLIDATADSKVFNLLATVARGGGRPMIWMEVFGGGLGGLVARSRPGLDPSPHDMRGVCLQYCTDNPYPASRSNAGSYETENEQGEVLVASDADVAIIAHHAARFAADCITSSERSKFPYSMYLIGLTEGWVFEAPFATIPISMESCPASARNDDEEKEFGLENREFLLGLIETHDDATASTTGDPVPTG